ncbi:hypothetical protein S40288_05632 [Stachybotrys chartarum IBT 40288]|nr:hypothetical protein S40288_05632 [Stachybotrys chartarum IBT 40288]
MSQFSPRSQTSSSSSPTDDARKPPKYISHKRSATDPFPDHSFDHRRPITPPSRQDYGSPVNDSPLSSPGRQRSNSRPLSMIQTYQPPLMDVNEDTIPELQPVFSLLNSHSNKLYQEGYFLKLDDQNTLGKPNQDRTWTECFAQLVGTVLSLWDAAELDAAGEHGEVLPKFINLTDASIKMIETLPTRSADEQPLQNILSISTAGRNRYLLHFNSHHSLVQWTAGIRLAMFEHSTLQEAYTGALIAGKGKTVNSINVIMERARFEIGEWVRVRFGAGVPWRRCWCVITPPDEKEYAKLQKEMKKRSPYDRSSVPALKGDIKFYDQRKDGKKQKKLQPIATITDAYSAYAIYPQAKSLVDASTLLKIEGHITIHTDPPSSSEGFVFIMPEVRPAVSGFEMLLRFLFPTWDTFGLYGRPGRLIASVLDSRSLMFAMPKHKRYGYLEVMDVTSLLVDKASSSWDEKEWRKRLKEVTGTRMNAIDEGTYSGNRSARSSYGASNSTFNGGKPKVGFADGRGSTRSSRSFSLGGGSTRQDSGPTDARRDNFKPAVSGLHALGELQTRHARNSSDPAMPAPSTFNQGHGSPHPMSPQGGNTMSPNSMSPPRPNELDGMRSLNTPEPVSRPPAFNHSPEARPASKVYHSPELRQANSRLSMGTLAQLAGAGGLAIPKDSTIGDIDEQSAREHGTVSGPPVHPHANAMGIYANDNRSREARSPLNQGPAEFPAPLNIPKERSQSPSPYGGPSSYSQRSASPSRPHTSDGRRPTGPPGGPQNAPRPPMPMNQNQWSNRSQTPPAGGYGRGRQPNAQPPGQIPPRQDSFTNTGPSPFSSGQGPRDNGQFHRKPVGFEGVNSGDKHASDATSRGSITTNEIIEHYASNHGQYRDPHNGPAGPSGRQLPFHPHPQRSDSPSADRPRAGVLKTVGGSSEPVPAPRPNFEVPDFGPTYNYANISPPRNRGPPHATSGQRPYSPAGPKPSSLERGPERKDSDDGAKRTLAWQPGGSAAGSGAPGLTAEQYVQQRAVAAQPQFAHARSPSGNPLPEASSATPNHVRRSSSLDMLQQRRSPGGSSDLHQRPSSRGGNAALGASGSGEASSHLTAREQEHVARVTGSPLVNVGGMQRGASPGPGLVGTIDARERERQQIRQGANSQAAQYAMNQRYQQGPGMGAHQQPMSPHYPPQGMGDYGMQQPAYQPMGRGAGGYPHGGAGHPQGGPYGAPTGHPMAAPYGPPASFSRPLRDGARTPQGGDPRMPPQGQYNPGQGGNQTQRDVYPQYQGQAF